MANDTVLTERHDNVLLITLNRPDAMNAINAELSRGLLDAINELDADPLLSVGVLTGNGRGFCAGMDLKEFTVSGAPEDLFTVVREGATKPLVAAIEGFALAGGLEIALTCDLLVAARGVKLGIPETSVGLFAAAGGLLRLPRRIPYAVAMEMALTGDPITAEQAHEYGLVNRLAERGQSVAVAMELAERIARNAPLSVVASKRIIRDLSAVPEGRAWVDQQPFIDSVFSSDDAREGPVAFAEKRSPNWSGH